MSDSVRPHKQQPIRLLCPWDSPGKNTGVGCHFLLQCMKVKNESEVAQSCPTLSDPMDCSPPVSSVHGFSRQEYWSGVPSPIASMHLFNSCSFARTVLTVLRRLSHIVPVTILSDRYSVCSILHVGYYSSEKLSNWI